MERIKDKGDKTEMNENLSEMVQQPTPPEANLFSEADLDLPKEEITTTVELPPLEESIEPVGSTTTVIMTSTLSDWFEGHCDAMDNINQVKVAIRGVDADKTLIMAVKNGNGEVDADDNDKRTLRVFDNADTLSVLNIPPLTMDVYNNGFRIVYEHNGIFIKTYGVRTGLICTLCSNVGGNLIPYAVVRVKKKDESLEIPSEIPSVTPEKLSSAADLEALQLLYKQSAKAVDDLSDINSVINWILERQTSVTDINHHLQIDNVIIDILK